MFNLLIYLCNQRSVINLFIVFNTFLTAFYKLFREITYIFADKGKNFFLTSKI